ncbi:MAG: mechanosensitive ion channel family protein [Myxococcales bacterium]|nr:mechanosensitive ion channel family protein [Myxococcales bacterium]
MVACATFMIAGVARAAPAGGTDGTVRALIEAYAPWLISFHVLGRESWRFIAAALTVLLTVLLRRAVMKLVMRGLRELTAKTKTKLDDALVEALDPPVAYFVLTFGLYLSLQWIGLPTAVDATVLLLYRLCVIILVGWTLLRCTTLVTGLISGLASRTSSHLDDHLVPMIGRIVRVIVFALVVVFMAQELGYSVGGLLAGLGVAGMAFALAAKDTLANWFGALMIYTDRPFEIGDWVKTSDLEGVVEDIGLRSTKVRTFAKTVVSVPNSALASDVIENFSRMPIRRVYFKFGVTYATTPAQMRETVERIKDILRAHPEVDQRFWLVKFNEFTDSALSIMLYFFTTTTDWERYLSIREEVNLKILERIEEIGVAAAFPTQSVYLEKIDPDERRRLDAQARALFEARPRVDDTRTERTTAPISEEG